MSLIRVRRNRKKTWLDHKKGTPPAKLVVLLVLVVGAIYYLTVSF